MNSDWAEATKTYRFSHFVRYVSFCDNNRIEPISGNGVNRWIDHNDHMHLEGKWNDGTCLSQVNTVLSILKNMDLNANFLWDVINPFGRTETESTQGYSDSDLKKLLHLLVNLFCSLYDQFIVNPKNFMVCPRWAESSRYYAMTFNYKGVDHKISSPINKLSAASCYLLSYYTWGNTTQLLEIKRPIIDGTTLSEKWAVMPAFKRRANRFVNIELGENDSLNVPKHAMWILCKIINISKNLSPEPGSLMLNGVYGGSLTPITGNHLGRFNRWLKRTFDLRDDFDVPLVPLVRRMRASGICRFQVFTNDSIKPAIVAGNEPRVVKRHYSEGNKFENDMQLQATSLTLENLARRKLGVKDAKGVTAAQLNVEVLPYEAMLNQLILPTRNANGSYCKDPYGDRSQKQNLRAQVRKVINNKSHLACADLLWCFECPYQVIVETVDDIWCILSFKECLEESAYMHLDRNHYEGNFSRILRQIDCRIVGVSKNVRADAERKLFKIGRHPAWLDLDNLSISAVKIDESSS
ncbi:hypothetical protein [Geomonas ferrireducens]|uniref:hypothetical protein n=1 Tax=Geomonas ferrireducens TaxID=2570227 RepID=UPI0010A92A40|nr:hypothetical protein [Geomonas ferrireducens]